MDILSSKSFTPIGKPKKLIFMLHGYGDHADNFINIAKELHQPNWQVNYIAINAPFKIPNYSEGRQWFNLYPNNIYISDAGPKEIEIIRLEILSAANKIQLTIMGIIERLKLNFSDCLVMGFSQGGMMTFEFGNFFKKKLACLAIMSGRIMENKEINNLNFLNTPIFISHGEQDDVLPVKNFNSSCEFLKKNKFNYEDYLIKNDSHTISLESIVLLQKFIKKNL